MSESTSRILKWALAGVYLAICSAPLLFLPRWVWPWLLATLAVWVGWSYWTWEKSVVRTLDARPLTRWDVPDYAAFRERLAQGCTAAGLKREPVWAVVQSKELDAMAIDGRRGMVLFSTALLKLHPQEELLAIAGHELHHLADRSSLPAMIGGVWLRLLAGIAAALNSLPLTAIIGVPLRLLVHTVAWLGTTVLSTRSRHEEHMADLAGARLTSAATMITMLERLHKADYAVYGEPFQFPAWSPLWITRRLHASHPATEKRVRFLTDAAERGVLRAG